MAKSKSNIQNPPEQHAPYILPLLVLLMSVVYALTLSPTVSGGDSGELIVVAYKLGVAHPPGYPLFTILGHLMTYLPIGSIAQCVNMLSVISLIVAGILTFKILVRWTRNPWAAFFTCGLFAFSPLTWRYAVTTEVFALNIFFVSLLCYLFLRYLESQEIKWVYWLVLSMALGFSNHHTLIFVAIPLSICVVIRDYRSLFKPKILLICLGLFIIGLLPYLYLPWASSKQEMFSWGNITTWKGFLIHFLRREYGTFELASGLEKAGFFVNIYHYLLNCFRQMLYVGFPLAIYGIWHLLRQRNGRIYALTLLCSLCFYLVVFNALSNIDLNNRLYYDVHSRFWLLPNWILFCFAALGFVSLIDRLRTLKRFFLRRSLIFPTFALILVGLQIGLNYKVSDHSKNRVFERLGKATLDSVPREGLLLLRGDVYVNAVRYIQECDYYRTDVKAIPVDTLWRTWMKPLVQKRFPDVVVPGEVYRYVISQPNQFNLKDFFDANYGRQPIFIGKLVLAEEEVIKDHYRLWNIGFLNKVSLEKEELQVAEYERDARAFFEMAPPKIGEFRDKSWEAFVYYNYWDRQLKRAEQLLFYGAEKNNPPEIVLAGTAILEKIIAEQATPPSIAYKNLGVAYQFLSRSRPMYKERMIRAWKKYLTLAPQSDPELPAIKKKVYRGEQQARK